MRIAVAAFATIGLAAGLPAVAGDCPATVITSIERAHAGAKTLACKDEHEGGLTLYEAKIRTADGKKLELDIRPDGTILQTEEHIATSAVPVAVLQSLHSKYPDATVKEAERLTAANGEISFEVAFSSGGRRKAMTVTEAGAFVEEEAEDDEDSGKDEDD